MIKVSITPEITHDSVAAHLESSVQGTPTTFDDQILAEISDITKIKKVFKLGALPSPSAKDSSQINGNQHDDARRRLELSMLGAIALRGS